MSQIELESLEWAKNAEDLLADETYKKHLIRQANRILIKLKTLSYIQNELIGIENAVLLDNEEATSFETIDLQLPELATDLPAEWWTPNCDTSMVIGVYIHGYEKYSKIRCDQKLCFLGLCGLPNAKDLLAEKQAQEQEDKDNEEDQAEQNNDIEMEKEKELNEETAVIGDDLKLFPAVSDLNNRLRKLIAAHQKIKKQMELASKRNAEKQEKRLSKLASTQERAVMRQIEKQSKWSRREEQNFYRTVSTFGVDCTGSGGQFVWDRFKEIGQFDKKPTETLNDYFAAFYFMCKKVSHKLGEGESLPANLVDLQVEVISEERATRCIQRVEMLNKVRGDIVRHEKFEEWISVDNCGGGSDLPDWWIVGKHDRELVKAAARYGITRTEFYYVIDGELTFKEALNKYMSHIYGLMMADGGGVEMMVVDPIQYYFQSQAKIQASFRKRLETENEGLMNGKKKNRRKENDDDDDDDDDKEEVVVAKTMKWLVEKVVEVVEGKMVKEDDEEEKQETICEMSGETEDANDQKLLEQSFIERTFEENSMFFGNQGGVPMIMWPKDRVLFNRLELIIQMFENGGEWPQRAAFVHPGQTPSNANPLSVSNLVNPLTPHGHFILSEQRKHMMSPSLLDHNEMSYPLDNPDDNSNSESDFLKYSNNTPTTGSSKKPKRGRPPKYEPALGMTPEYTSRSRNQHSNNKTTTDSRDGYSSNDDYDDNNSNDTPARSKFLEPGEVLRPGQQNISSRSEVMAKGDERSVSVKRGRKSSIIQPKSPQSLTVPPEMSQQDAATAAALAAMFLAPGQDPEERVTVINVKTGLRLTGNKAPRRQDLPMWLISHTDYLPDESEIINLAMKQNQMNGIIIDQDQAVNRNSRANKTNSHRQSHVNTQHDEDEPMSPKPNTVSLKHQQTSKEKTSTKSGNQQASSGNELESGGDQAVNNVVLATEVGLFNKNTGKL